tara:strand:- start:70 stop:720 length:651 start_codon:yes stop_codon:yes gene_type:complete
MKSYPATIVDNFFDNPDEIRDLALSLNYPDHNSRWPGRRSLRIENINRSLFHHIGNKIFSIFGQELPETWDMCMQFQIVKPFSENKWDIKNRGWVHNDGGDLFGGIIYLNKNPDMDTGTSIYKAKLGIYDSTPEQHSMKASLYSGKDINIDEYTKHFNEYHNQFIETVKVGNVYNRLLLFGGDVQHGVRTYGTEERLTLAFFCNEAYKWINPLMRY